MTPAWTKKIIDRSKFLTFSTDHLPTEIKMEIKKLDLTSTNIVDEQRQKIKELFPEVFTEGNKIDFERLKLTLGGMVDPGKERYGMNWPGKADCFKIIQQPSIATLTPDRGESVAFDTTENLFIEGDNLEVLKLLQKSYFGKIKLICIDPPYNTGNDFIYPDNYSESLDTYLRYTGQIDDEGRKYSTNTEADGRFHSKWMNMMYPRLFLARNLLQGDGIILICIDDNEVGNLMKICDEIYGEENFVANFVWRRRASSALAEKLVSTDHEYVICYQKMNFNKFKGIAKDYTSYDNPDNDPRGDWTLGDLTVGMTKDQRPNQYYELKDPQTGYTYKPNPNRVWAYIRESMDKMIQENRIYFPKDTSKRPMVKRFKSQLKADVNPVSTWLTEVGLNAEATRIIQELFRTPVFNYSKPLSLIKHLLKHVIENGDYVLDFFSGSASTAHATLEQNKEDGGHRKFIMVQLPEPTDEKSEAHKDGYKTIADIGKERIRRVIKKIREEQGKKNDLFSGDKPPQDLGFKVFKLQPSNFKLWNGEVAKDKETIEKQLVLFVEHINPKSSQEDILYEILLKSGFPLTTKIEKIMLAEKTVFSIADGSMFICLEKDLTPEVIKAMAEKKPVRVVCLDEGFKGNDQLKTNAVQIMKTRNITFRTV
jgi:adenine-specific DNA-methyltransferase